MSTGAQIFLDLLAESGVRYLFGNPGSTELPLMDALAGQSRIDYILALHEIPAMAMADGYAQATGAPGAVNLHVACGLGNAMGMLYNAWCAGSPLIVTAGQQDRRLRFSEPVLAGENVDVARPWTKWAAEVQRVGDIPAAVRRAVQTALTPPTGPVFLSLPVDIQTEAVEAADLTPARVPDTRVRPPAEALLEAAKLLAGAKRPAILAGSRVTESGASSELAAVAHRLGAPVFSETPASQGRMAIASEDPLYAGGLPLWSSDLHSLLSDFDVALVVGMDLFRLYIHQEPENPMPESLVLVQLDSDPRQLSKNHPAEVALLGDPKTGLAELDGLLASFDMEPAATERRSRLAATHNQRRDQLRAEIEKQWDRRPMRAHAVNGAVAKVLPADAAIIDEAVTTNQNLLARLGALKDPAAYFSHRGWALGWGLGCAIGVKLAWPERPVIAMLGDGSSLYGIQGLWTAARYRLPVIFLIENNAQYAILKMCGDVMKLPEMCAGKHVGMDLVDPEVDFVSLARSLGVAAHRVSSPDELMERVRTAITGDAPILLDVPMAR